MSAPLSLTPNQRKLLLPFSLSSPHNILIHGNLIQIDLIHIRMPFVDIRTRNQNHNLRIPLQIRRRKFVRNCFKVGSQIRFLTASPFLLADLELAGFGFVVAGDSEGCDGELAVNSDGVARARTNGHVLVENCCVAVLDLGLPDLC